MAQTLRLLDLFRFYRGEPHQMAAIAELEGLIQSSAPPILSRDQGWYQTWTASGKTPEPAWLPLALATIKQFEGCRLDAYPDPATGGAPWTIGWGNTRLIDRAVQPDDHISQQMADDLLLNTVELCHQSLLKLLPQARDWSPNRLAALISWASNVGLSAVEASTLRRRLLAGEAPETVIAEELPRWNQAGGRSLAGLSRRRAAEVALFLGHKQPPLKSRQEAHAIQHPSPADRQPQAPLTPASPFSALLTPHIRLGEFALDQQERRFHHQHQLDTAAELAAFLEHARAVFGAKPLIITSGYRPPAINAACGGAANSEHLFSAPNIGAVDWFIEGVNIHTLQDWCVANWPYSTGKGASRGFIHTGIRQGRPRVSWIY